MFTLHLFQINRFFSLCMLYRYARKNLSRHASRSVPLHQAFHLLDGHLIEVTIDSILQSRSGQGKVKPLLRIIGISQQAIKPTDCGWK